MKLLAILCVIFAIIGLALSESSRCLQPEDPGLCYGAKPRYAYSREAGCHQFTYGGCGGNDNNFQSYEECERACLIPR